MIGLLIVAVVAISGVAFMMGGGLSSSNVIGRATLIGDYDAKMLTEPTVSGEIEKITTFDARAYMLSQRAKKEGSYISARELFQLFPDNGFDSWTANTICKRLGFQGCIAVELSTTERFYESTNGRCQQQQLTSRDHYLKPCSQGLFVENMGEAFFSPSVVDEGCSTNNYVAEPMLGDYVKLDKTSGILCQK